MFLKSLDIDNAPKLNFVSVLISVRGCFYPQRHDCRAKIFCLSAAQPLSGAPWQIFYTFPLICSVGERSKRRQGEWGWAGEGNVCTMTVVMLNTVCLSPHPPTYYQWTWGALVLSVLIKMLRSHLWQGVKGACMRMHVLKQHVVMRWKDGEMGDRGRPGLLKLAHVY